MRIRETVRGSRAPAPPRDLIMLIKSSLPPTALALILAATLGCTRPGPASADRAGPKVYKLVGVVREIDPAAGLVQIQHEEIPGLMPAMQMPFSIEDRELLEELRPGDEVEGVLRIAGGSTRLDDLTVTRPA